VGTTTAGRRHVDQQQIMGMFVNTLALRNYPAPWKTFKEFLSEVKERTLQAFENQDYQFEELVEKVVERRDTGHSPLFDVRFALPNMGETTGEEPPGKSAGKKGAGDPGNMDFGMGMAKFDMTLFGSEQGGRLSFSLEYCTKLFKQETIVRFANYFKKIVSAVLASPGGKLEQIEIITGEEKNQILSEFNDTGTVYPESETLYRLFREQARKMPDNTPVVYGNVQLTYKDLNEKSNQLAVVLGEKGLKPGDIAAVMLEKSIEMMVAILAVIKTGAVYLPLDPKSPGDETQYILADSCPQMLLYNGPIREGIKDTYQVIALEDLDFNSPGPINPDRVNAAKDPACIIYTSGSTGRPAGVLLEHGAIIHSLYGFWESYPAAEPDRFLLNTSSGSNVSLSELFGWIPAGSALVLPGEEDVIDTIARAKITHIHFTPLMFNAFLASSSAAGIDQLSPLKYIFLTGDELLAEPVNKFRQLNTGIRLENLFSVTEKALYTAKYSLSHRDGDGMEKIPVGKPLPDAGCFILDGNGHLMAPGITGELYISGAGLGRGYLNDPELTADRFVTHPLAEGDMLFGTGDRAKWLADGNIEFCGRQLTVEGAIVELGEIEDLLLKERHIKEAVVLPIEEDGHKSFCAYISPDQEINPLELRNYLTYQLPAFMVPSHFVQVEKIPLTARGRLAKSALPDPGARTGMGYAAPRNELERKLCDMWSEILGIEKEKISIEDNFFELEGNSNSLHLIMFVSRIYNDLGVQLPISQVYEYPSIKEIGKFIVSKRFAEQPVVLLNRSRPKKLFCFPPRIGVGLCFGGLAAALEDYSVYALNFIEDDDRLQQYVELLTGIQPGDSYKLLGYSAAGRLTLEVAKALENNGCEVSDIIFADCFLSENLSKYAFTQEHLQEYYGIVEENLERWGLADLKQKVINRTRKYIEYIEEVTHLEAVNANIHLVLSDDNRKSQWVHCWDDYTGRASLRYHGVGQHQRMFRGEALEKNAQVVKKILDSMEY
jgi:amino acid adenylation domain-containing protein